MKSNIILLTPHTLRLLIITSALALALRAQTPVARAGDCDDGIDQAQFQDNNWQPKDKNDKKPPHQLKKAECEGCQKFYDDLQKALNDCYAKQLEDIGDIDYSAPGAEEKQKKKNDAKDALGGAKGADKAKPPKGKTQQALKDDVKKKWEALKGQLGSCKNAPYPGLIDAVIEEYLSSPTRGTPTGGEEQPRTGTGVQPGGEAPRAPTPAAPKSMLPQKPEEQHIAPGAAAPPTPIPQEHAMAPRQPGKTGETCAVLVATGKVKIETSGTGETIGHIADLKIQNLTDQPLTCAITPIILESGGGKNQHYACPSPQTVALDPHQTKTVPINGVCLNRNKPPVGKGVSGDLVINEANPSGPQNPNSHLPATDAAKLLRSCAAKYTAADQLQKSGALKNLPYHDPQKQKDIVVQWSTWTDPQICALVGSTPATKDDLKKVVYKQVEEKGPMSPETKKKVDQGIDIIFEKVELTTAKAKDLEKPERETPSAPGTTVAETPTATPPATEQPMPVPLTTVRPTPIEPTPTATPTPTPKPGECTCAELKVEKMEVSKSIEVLPKRNEEQAIQEFYFNVTIGALIKSVCKGTSKSACKITANASVGEYPLPESKTAIAMTPNQGGEMGGAEIKPPERPFSCEKCSEVGEPCTQLTNFYCKIGPAELLYPYKWYYRFRFSVRAECGDLKARDSVDSEFEIHKDKETGRYTVGGETKPTPKRK